MNSSMIRVHRLAACVESNQQMIPELIEYEATPAVQEAIASLGRTEDIRFSPSGKILAISAFRSSYILLLKIGIVPSASGPKISLTDFVRISSRNIDQPHGMTFLDEGTLVIANRNQFVSIFQLPAMGGTEKDVVVKPLKTIWRKGVRRLNSPGSVEVYPISGDDYRLLVCDNYGHVVTTVQLTNKNRLRAGKNRVLLDNGLDIPDGITVSANLQWIAVSNHTPGTVLVYVNEPSLNRASEPAAILQGMDCPHGIRFAGQDSKIIVADAARPYVHVYASKENHWNGEYEPHRIVRVMDDTTFQLGRYNEEEGGPKGIDADQEAGVFVMTCEYQPLTFYNIDSFLVD